jgi:hypothetical protein
MLITIYSVVEFREHLYTQGLYTDQEKIHVNHKIFPEYASFYFLLSSFKLRSTSFLEFKLFQITILHQVLRKAKRQYLSCKQKLQTSYNW